MTRTCCSDLRALVDAVELDRAGLEHHVAADVAVDAELGFAAAGDAVVVPLHVDGERRAVDAVEGAGVELGDDVAGLAGLEQLVLERRRRAAAARTHAHQLDVLLVDVLDGELVDGVRAAGDGAEIVFLFGEHLRDPVLGRSLFDGTTGHDSSQPERSTHTRTHGTDSQLGPRP